MMKTVLCFGDSNTYGWDAASGGRFDRSIRWTGRLEAMLPGARIIEEGQCGRTTVWSDPVGIPRCGKDYLLPCLDSHRPLDAVVIALGTNDMKHRFSLTARDIAEGAGTLVQMTQTFLAQRDGTVPPVLLISPPRLEPEMLTHELGGMFEGQAGLTLSRALGGAYAVVAERLGCMFLDAARVTRAGHTDGIHLDPAGHEALARAVAALLAAALGG